MIAAIWICAYLCAGSAAAAFAERGSSKRLPTWPLVMLVLFWPMVFAAFGALALLCVPDLLTAARRRISGRREP
jgi:hypothetical protein